MLTIRLQRTGKKNQADFRIVLAEKEAPVKKKHLEVLGSYNPRKKDFKVNEERTKYWITQRVALSPTVHNLFVTKGLVEGVKVKAFSIPKKKDDDKKAQVKAEFALTTPSSSAEATAATPPSTFAKASADGLAGGEKIDASVSEEIKPVEASPAPGPSTSTETPAAA